MASQFYYRGRVPASKSILNRLLILQSFSPELVIRGDSAADDVQKMRSALAELLRGDPADCGAAGTTLRFLALRASRISGAHQLRGTERLLSRPQSEIGSLLSQLGCEAEFSSRALSIRGSGWRKPSGRLKIDRSISSQFASALVLSAWGLEFPLELEFEGERVSEGYFAMTLELARRAGMQWETVGDNRLLIPARSQLTVRELEAETDISSVFALAAVAAVSGAAEFEAWPERSLQPDSLFPKILQAMGCRAELVDSCLRVERPEKGLRATQQDLGGCPDLFPVLSVLCALASGRSRLFGAPQLQHKESSRIEKSAELVRLLGRNAREISGGLEIEGSVSPAVPEVVDFDPSEDHRLAMAAAVACAAGFQIRVQESRVVDKSFPEFWELLEKGGVRCAQL